MNQNREVWIPEDDFISRHRDRFVVEEESGQTIHIESGAFLWTEFGAREISDAVQRHESAEAWTEHLTGDGSTFYTRGAGLLNRSGGFILVRRSA